MEYSGVEQVARQSCLRCSKLRSNPGVHWHRMASALHSFFTLPPLPTGFGAVRASTQAQYISKHPQKKRVPLHPSILPSVRIARALRALASGIDLSKGNEFVQRAKSRKGTIAQRSVA